MSAYAAAVAGADGGARVSTRHLMALKILSNLHSLRAHPSLAEPMRRVTAKLHRHLSAIASADAAALALH